MQIGFLSHSTEQLVGRISVVVCVENSSRGRGSRHTVMRRSRCSSFVGITNPRGCVHPRTIGSPHRGPAKARGVVEEQEEHGGSERVLEPSEDRANEVVDTASESSVRALQECMLTSVSSVQAPWTPRLGIQLRGFDPDHALRSSPMQGLFGCGFRRAEDPEVLGPHGWGAMVSRLVFSL